MMTLLWLPVWLFRLLYQSMFLALAQVAANKARSVLTMTGIIIGVASVTAVIAALTGLKQNVLSEFEALGTNKIFISPWRPESGPKRHAPWWVLRFSDHEFDSMLDQCPSVRTFTRLVSFEDKIAFGQEEIENVSITGIDPAWHEIENRSLLQGRPFSLIDSAQARSVCLINPEARDKLELDIDCVGQSILIGNRRYVITGLVEPRAEQSMFGSGRSGAEVLIPFTTARKTRSQGYYYVIAASRRPELSEDARAELTFFLRRQKHLKPGEADTFRMEVVEKYLQQFNAIAVTITTVAAGVVGISLLVGGVGIMNIMLVSVSERTREIGLRKAVGARPAAILLQFLVEAIIICLIGGLIGLACGWGLTRLIASIPNAKLDRATIPLWAIALAFGFAAAVGLIFGMFPALKAARLDPIEALRHE